eukprot:gene7334-8154_t
MSSEKSKERVIVLPVDGSSNCRRAFQWYLKNLRRSNDRLAIVNVIEPPVVPSSFIMMGPVVISEEWQAEVEDNIARAKRTAKEFEAKCEEANLPCKILTETSDDGPGPKICEVAKEERADAVVMGSRGLNLLRRTFLGSTSSYVVNHTKVPVVVTPRDDETRI